jgi:AmiR/NasT family two-component response regulator
MVSQPPSIDGLVFESLEASYRAAQLEAEIAQLKDALARRQQIGVATGLLAQRFADHHERAWSLLVRLSQNCHCALP